MGSTVMESSKGSSKKIPKKRRSLRINMPRLIRSASPTKGGSAKIPVSATLPPCPQSAPVQSKPNSGSPKSIFPYPSHQNSPKSPRRLSFSGIFRSSSGSPSSSIKIFSRTRRGNSLVQISYCLSQKYYKTWPRQFTLGQSRVQSGEVQYLFCHTRECHTKLCTPFAA
uniref:Uncharacterized protein n=1 Tax=Amphilophus citrinellus TaxID=61819 RepID=A0A3Q0S5T9_AMPCI